MTLFQLAYFLESADVRLSLKLVVDAPVGTITPELREALVEHKPHLMVRLAREAQWEALRDVRWGPAVDDPEPGLEVPRRASCGGCLRIGCPECDPPRS